MACAECPPGYKRLTDCGNTVDQCTVCDEGEYTDTYHTRTHCKRCRLRCPKTYQVILKPCQTTSDVVCECKQGYFLEHKSDIACTYHTRCLPGFGASKKGTPHRDAECTECPQGFFSTRKSSTEECFKLNDCSREGGVKVAGDTTRDNICNQTQFAGLSPAYIGLISVVGIVVLIIIIGLTIYYKRRRNGGFLNSASGKLRALFNKDKYCPSRSETLQNNLTGSLNIHMSVRTMVSQHSTTNNLAQCQSSQAISPPGSRMSSTHNFNQEDVNEEKFMNQPVLKNVEHSDDGDHADPRPSREPVLRMMSDCSSASLEAAINQPLLNQPPPVYGEVRDDHHDNA